MDEYFYKALVAINPRWAKSNTLVDETDEIPSYARTSAEKGNEETLDILKDQNLEMQKKLQRVESEMEDLRQKMTQMQELMGLGDTPTTTISQDANAKAEVFCSSVTASHEEEGSSLFGTSSSHGTSVTDLGVVRYV